MNFQEIKYESPGTEEQFFSKGGPNKKKNEILSFSKNFTK